MEEPIVVGIDIGTTKICTLVARLEGDVDMRILGVGIEPALGIKKGNVVDISAATQSISRSIEKAQRTSGLEIQSALVSLAGSHVTGMNSRGVVGVSGGIITQADVDRSLEAAMAVAMPHNREIIHVVQRGFTVDGQDGIQSPVNFSGFRLEVEAHIITAAAATVENLRQCVNACNVDVLQFVLNPLASGEVVLNKAERDMGVCVCDIGGGTSDLAIYINGDVWHTNVLPVGGSHITHDIAIGLRISPEQAEQIKKQYGHAITSEVGEGERLDRLFLRHHDALERRVAGFGEPLLDRHHRGQFHRDDLLGALHTFYPEYVGARVVEERLLIRRDCPAFAPGSHADRPGVATPHHGIALAGDFVRLPIPSALMERAVASGFLAANHLLAPHGVRPEPIRSIPRRGLLGRWAHETEASRMR